MHRSNYSKVEKGERELSVEATNKIAILFGLTIDQLLNMHNHVPQEITIEDKTLMEQVKLISQLEPDEKSMIFKMIYICLTKKKFKDFFAKNIAVL